MHLQLTRRFAEKLIKEGDLNMKLGKEINWALDQLDQAVQSNNAKDQQIADLQKQLGAQNAQQQDQEDKDAITRLDATFAQNNPGDGTGGDAAVAASAAAVTTTPTDKTTITVGG